MKKLVLSFIVLAFSASIMASEYVYTCASSKNQKIFAVGQSQNIVIEISSDLMFINNYSKIWNSLNLDDEINGLWSFKSFSTGTLHATLGLTANINSKMVEGATYGQITLFRELDSNSLTQDYSCLLTETRR